MNPNQAFASGTKAGNLANPIPGVSDTNANATQANAQVATTDKKPIQSGQPQPDGGSPQPPAPDDQSQNISDQLDSLLSQSGGTGPLTGQGSNPKFASAVQNTMNNEGTDAKNFAIDKAKSGSADLVQNGIPAATDAAATIGGGLAGSVVPGFGTAAGAEAGHLTAAAVNTALAPTYRDIANKLRDMMGVDKDDSSDLHARITQGLQEAIGLVLPKIFGGGMAARDYTAAKVVDQDPAIVAQNLKNVQAAKDAGLTPDPRMLFDKTSLSSKIDNGLQSIMNGDEGTAAHDTLRKMQQNNIGLDNPVDAQGNPIKSNAVLDAFNKVKDAVGSTVDDEGNVIIRPENIQKRADQMIGPQIGDLNKQAVDLSEDKAVNIAPVLDRFKKAMSIAGIPSTDGAIPKETLKGLDPEALRLANKYNDIISGIKQNMAENGATLEEQQMKTPDPGDTASAAEIPDDAPDQQHQMGVPLSKLQEMTGALQDLANFDGKDRGFMDKQFGGIANQARQLRDQMSKNVFDAASQTALQNGDSEQARILAQSSDRLTNLNQAYGAHKDAQKTFAKAVLANGNDAVNLMRKTNKVEWSNLVDPEKGEAVLTDTEQSALKSSYVKNLIDESSNQGVIDPDKVQKIMDKDSDKASMLFGDDWGKLQQISNMAKIAQKIDSNVGASSTPLLNKIVSAVGGLKSSAGAYFAESMFSQTPNVKKVLYDMPGYQNAIEKYMTPMTPFQRTVTNPVVQGKLATQAAKTAVAPVVAGNKTMKDVQAEQ